MGESSVERGDVDDGDVVDGRPHGDDALNDIIGPQAKVVEQ